VVKRGFDELLAVPAGAISEPEANGKHANGPDLPVMVKALPASTDRRSDVQRFWEQTGSFYARGMG
ncbi:MAG: hypothetical protein KC591_01060, partial [Gemmatimonadetes bacterium]|nr:hypothetical protein [Gemmatimonadota bacterium]